MHQTDLYSSYDQRWKILSGSWLKLLAIVSMTIDHTAQHVFYHLSSLNAPLFTLGNRPFSCVLLMVCFGRLAFPLFAFLAVEGFIHTRDFRKYSLNLLLFALLSVIPWHLIRYGCMFSLRSQNVLFTLLLGILSLDAVRRWENGQITAFRLLISMLTLLITADLLHTDYGARGLAFILAIYILRHKPALQATIGWCLLPFRWVAAIAFIPMNMYNGRRGFIQGAVSKYAFYAFYPLHLLVLYYLQCCVITA